MRYRRPPTDSQRSKLYGAEKVLNAHPRNERFADLAACAAYIRRVKASPWTQRTFPAVNPAREIAVVNGRRRALSYGGKVALPEWARTTLTILHELAHEFRPGPVRRADGHAAHGWQFAGDMLALVGHFMGSDAAEQLRKSYKANRVRYTAPRKSSGVVHPNALAALAAVNAARRAAKDGPAREVAVVEPALSRTDERLSYLFADTARGTSAPLVFGAYVPEPE